MIPDTNDDFYALSSTKTDPTNLKELMVRLEPYLKYKLIPVNTRFSVASSNNKQKCYFLKSGAVSMYRQPGDILVELFDAPTLRGAIPQPVGTNSIYIIKVIVPSEVAIIERDELFTLLTTLNLWEIFAKHQLAINSMIIERIFKLTSPSAYDTVRHQLFELINSSENIRENVIAEEYIRSKTRMSRSGIMRILSELREEGQIVIEKGILKAVKICKK